MGWISTPIRATRRLLGRSSGKAEPKVPCQECGVMILPATARETGGLCMRCHRTTPEIRRQREAAAAAVADGSAFRPLPHEQAGARDPADFVDVGGRWRLSEDVYADRPGITPEAALAGVQASGAGEVYLASDDGYYLVLEVRGGFGVCTLSPGAELRDGRLYYAWGPRNARAQVPADSQVSMGCPCCGTGILTHPSRAHMPASEAIAVFRAAMEHDYTRARWLEYDPGDFVQPGFG